MQLFRCVQAEYMGAQKCKLPDTGIEFGCERRDPNGESLLGIFENHSLSHSDVTRVQGKECGCVTVTVLHTYEKSMLIPLAQMMNGDR